MESQEYEVYRVKGGRDEPAAADAAHGAQAKLCAQSETLHFANVPNGGQSGNTIYHR
jgi:hypothetical protein